MYHVYIPPPNNQADASKVQTQIFFLIQKWTCMLIFNFLILTDKFLLETKLSSDLILSGFKKSSLLWTKFEESVWLPSPTAGACPKQSDIIIIIIVPIPHRPKAITHCLNIHISKIQHIYIHTHMHAHTHSYTHTVSLSLSHTHTYTHTHTESLSLSHTQSISLSLSHTHTHNFSLSLSHTHTPTHTLVTLD